MATTIVMPKAGNSVETCIMGRWLKEVGDSISAGDIVFEYETDKSSFEYRAETEGILLKKLYEEGDDVPVMVPVCFVGMAGEALPDQELPVNEEVAAKEITETETSAENSLKTVVPGGKRTGKISPRAKKIAEKMALKGYEEIAGTGPGGRIIERDIRSYAKTYVPAADKEEGPKRAAAPELAVMLKNAEDYTDVKLSTIRKVIAKNMFTSLSTMAQLTHSSSFDATEILAYRAKLKEAKESMEIPNITLNDIVMYAVSRIVLKHGDLNAHFHDDHMRLFHHVNLGMAVDTPRGLMVPTIFHADQKSLAAISAEARQLAEECQTGSIDPEKLSGASITVTNLGAFGMESFTPVINPPQTAIVGVCSIVDRVRREGETFNVYPAMGLSLTYDHRAVDGAPASRFLQELCRTLEQFSVLLAK